MKTNKPIKWLIPKRHTLTTTDECNHLLNSGYTLINNMGYVVFLNHDNKQIKTNRFRTRNYKFSNPQLWQVLDTDSSNSYNETVIMDTTSFIFKLEYYMSLLASKFF